MKPFFISPSATHTVLQATGTEVHYEPAEHDITEGGEYLDDAIRMIEQPLEYIFTVTDFQNE
ncbi:hypothetical protein [Flavihumibacter petaseus]|uniref:Uncharacterized protein n=1 Tax=Flavihumibacter petaseus NBRC 106054 TaxID=1220578 RepID=A0A0E9N1V7_9BACT|nr:hypothetical protein [Flavihumibacter petaseus]GAO44002.1 hypothetical protein FPE01S_03_00410 [Flavihumibacter petaseus NBRC 106054]